MTNRFTSHTANVVMQAHLDAGDILAQRFLNRLGRFDQMRPYLLSKSLPISDGIDLKSNLLKTHNPLILRCGKAGQ
jgi:hypothetical protein